MSFIYTYENFGSPNFYSFFTYAFYDCVVPKWCEARLRLCVCFYSQVSIFFGFLAYMTLQQYVGWKPLLAICRLEVCWKPVLAITFLHPTYFVHVSFSNIYDSKFDFNVVVFSPSRFVKISFFFFFWPKRFRPKSYGFRGLVLRRSTSEKNLCSCVCLF